MSDISTRRRRIGIAAITTTALALPLTASISYAQPGQDQEAARSAIETIDPADEEFVWISQEEQTAPDAPAGTDADGEHQIEVRIIREGGEGADGERQVIRRVVRRGEHGEMSEAELEAMMAELEAELEGLDADVERRIALAMEHRTHNAEGASRFVFRGEDEGGEAVEVRCEGDQAVAHQELADGRRAMVICHTAIRAHATEGLRAAMSAIAGNEQIPAETREEIIRELESAIEEMEGAREEARQVSYRMTPPKPPAAPIAPRTAVAFRFSADAPLAEDCDEAEAQRPARVVWRVTA